MVVEAGAGGGAGGGGGDGGGDGGGGVEGGRGGASWASRKWMDLLPDLGASRVPKAVLP